MTTNRNLTVTPDFKEAVRLYAWSRRMPMSDVVVEAIIEISKETIDPVGEPMVPLTAEIKYPVPHVEYAIAITKAREAGVSLSELIRARIARKIAQANG